MVALVLTIAAKAVAVTESAEAWPRPILERVARSPAYPVLLAAWKDWKARVLAWSAPASQAVPLALRGSVAVWLVLAMDALPADPA